MHLFSGHEFESFITFTCPVCKDEIQDVIGVPSDQSGAETFEDRIAEAEQEYICGRCLSPFKLLVKNLGNRITVTLIGLPNVGITASQAYWTDEVEALGFMPWEMLDIDPYSNFFDTIRDVLEVIQSPHVAFFGKILPRMAFIQLFAALEAYLSDTLLRRMMDDETVLTRMLAGVKDLQDVKLPLSQIIADPEIGKKTAAATIRKLMFHNFMKVDAIWNKAFDFSIFRNEGARSKLLTLVNIRHDCVHRNGKTETGTQRTEVDFDFVREVARQFENTVLHIQGRFEGEDWLEDDEEDSRDDRF